MGKSDKFGFLRKILVITKVGEMVYFGTQNQPIWAFLLFFSLDRLWSCTWWHCLTYSFLMHPFSTSWKHQREKGCIGIEWVKKWFKVNVLIFTENFYFVQNGVDGTFLGSKTTFLKFSLNLFIRFSWNCTRWYNDKSEVFIFNFLFFILFSFTQNGKMGQFGAQNHHF